jgi:DNA-binding cell septation regulator SpoVG
MKAIREIKQVKDNKIIIELPEDFSDDGEVEVIIHPINKKLKREKLRQSLLDAPTLTEDELSELESDIKQVRDWMNEWKIQEF